MRFEPVPCFVSAVLLCSACGPPVTFGIDGRSAVLDASRADVAVGYAAPSDYRVTVEGPHAVGSTVPVVATRRGGPVDLWEAEVGPPDRASLARRFDNGDDMRLEIDLLDAGASRVDIRNLRGEIAGSIELEARFVAGATLVAYDDLVVGAPEATPVAPDGVIRILEDSLATLAVVWLDADGVPLTGTGLLDVVLDDPLGALRLTSIGPGDVPGIDTFTLAAQRRALTDTYVNVFAGQGFVGRWPIQIVGADTLGRLDLVEQEDFGLFGRVGYVHAIAIDVDEHRLIGPQLRWTDDSEPLTGFGSYVQLRDGCASYVEACATVNGMCVGQTVEAEAAFVGTAVARNPLIRCSHGPPPRSAGAALWGAVLLVLARRRRRVVPLVALLGLATFASPAHAQEPAPDPVGAQEEETSEEEAPTEEAAPAEETAPESEGEVPSQRLTRRLDDEEQGLKAEFRVVPVVAWGLHSPRSATAPVRSNLVLGASARLGYQRALLPKIQLAGTGQVSLTGMLGNRRRGWELRGTGLIGPQFGRGKGQYRLAVTPLVGMELIVDRYRYYCRPYGTAFSFSLPVMARVRLAFLVLEGGIAASWFIAPGIREPVVWKVSDFKGFGDEFEFRAAATFLLDRFKLGVNLRTRVASYGDQTWLGLGLAYSAFF